MAWFSAYAKPSPRAKNGPEAPPLNANNLLTCSQLKQKEKPGLKPFAALAAAAPPSPSLKLKQKANSGLPQSQLFFRLH